MRPQGWESTPTDARPGHIPGPRTEGRRLAEEGHPLEPTLGPMSKEETGHNREAVAMGEGASVPGREGLAGRQKVCDRALDLQGCSRVAQGVGSPDQHRPLTIPSALCSQEPDL